MKKILCTLLALAMLCSFMVINVSAEYDSSTYWETDYFVIDSDVELVAGPVWSEDGYEAYSYALYAGPDELGGIAVWLYNGDDCDEEYEDLLEHINEDCTNVKDVVISGLSGVQGDENWDEYISRYTLILDGETIYWVAVEGSTDFKEQFDILCNVVENDLRFTSAPADDNKTEDTKNDAEDNTDIDEDDEKSDDKNDTEEKDNSVVIIAVVAGVVILGVTAMVIFGKKKKQ